MNMVKTISASLGWRLLRERAEAMLFDVRSSMEYLFVGHPVDALNVPWIDAPDWTVNPRFAAEIRLEIERARPADVIERIPVLLICRSGVRSLEAGQILVEAGFGDVYNIAHGFEGDLDAAHRRGTVNGWRYDGLPWVQC
jgi:rhodanese-related sulfurtransferase